MTPSLRAVALVLAFSGFGPAARAAPPPAEVFFRNPDVGEAVLSPSGRQLAITSVKGLERAGLVVFDLAPGGQMTRIAQFSNVDVSDVGWLDDNRLIFGVRDALNGSGRSRDQIPLYTVNADGSHMRKLTLGSYRVLRVPVPVPGQPTEEILMTAPAGSGGELTPLWVDIRNNRTHTPAQLNAPAHAVGWIADSRGELRVAFTRDEGRQAAWWRAPGGTAWTRLYESALLDPPFRIADVDDAGGLYVTVSNGPEGYHWLTRYDFQAGKPGEKFIAKTPGFDFEGSLLVEDGSGKALGLRLLVDGETTVWFDPGLKALQAQADRLFPNHVNRIDCRRCGKADSVAVVYSYSDHDPGRLYLHQAHPPQGEKAWRLIGATMESVDPTQMAGMTLHRIEARDGRDLPVWITRADGAAGPLPAVVLVHGGPWARGSQWAWQAMPQFLASRGYVVIEPEMRGSTGYGTAHFKAGFKQWGQAMQDDVADALRWAQARGIAGDKACIAGDSYGGYSALMGLANDPGLFRCGIAGFAPSDLDLMVSGSWWLADDFNTLTRKYAYPELVGDPERDAAMLAAQSPVNVAARIKAPVMLISGEKDRRTPLVHAERMRTALRKAGNEPVWVVYDDEGHSLGSPKNRIDRAQRMEAFLAKYLGPSTPP